MDLLQELKLQCQTQAGQTEISFNATLKIISYLMCHQIQKKVLLLYDGLVSHISPTLIRWARENNVILFVTSQYITLVATPRRWFLDLSRKEGKKRYRSLLMGRWTHFWVIQRRKVTVWRNRRIRREMGRSLRNQVLAGM